MTIALGLVVALLQALAAAGQPPRGTIVEHVSCPSDPSRVLTRLTGDDVPLVDELRSRLNLESLSKAAHGEGYDADSATRSLALVRIQLSTIARDLRERHDVRADV